MTATSPKSGRARFSTTLYQADEPIDAAFGRNVTANNALHGADEQARVLVNLGSIGASLIPGNPPNTIGIAQSGTTGAWVPVRSFGPFAISVREDAVAYVLRVRCAASMSFAGPTADIAVTVGSAASLADLTYATGQNAVQFVPAAGVTPTVLTPMASDLITIGRGELEGSYVVRPTFDDASGSPVEILVPELVVRLWAIRRSAAVRIHQLHVAEYVG